MPKKKHQDTPEEQSARFTAEAEKLIAAGELSPTDAERLLDSLVRKARLSSQKPRIRAILLDKTSGMK